MSFLRINPERSRSLRILASILAVPVVSWVAGAATAFLPDGGEYLPSGPLPGDQTAPAVAFSSDGGFLVWQDSSGNGDGAGIRARRIGKTLTGSFPSFWVNSNPAFINEAPDVALLGDGGAAFVWQGGPLGRSGIYARFLRPMTTTSPNFATEDVEIAAAGGNINQFPRITRLLDGSVVVTWTNVGQDGDLAGVAVQKLSPAGQKIGSPFFANVTTAGNQRSPSIAATLDGGFAIAWIGENQRYDRSADVYARVFSSSGFPLSGEVRLNASTNLCSAPSITALPSGGFVAAWSEYDFEDVASGWDVVASAYDASAAALRSPGRINAYRLSNQINPRVAVAGDTILATWTSDGQDGSREGVFGRYLAVTGEVADDEFGLNDTVISQQKEPTVASDGVGRFVAAWTSFQSVSNGFDVIARKYVKPASIVALQSSLELTANGARVGWSTETGARYQVQRSAALTSWSNDGAARTAAGSSDSVTVPLNSVSSFFRIVRLP